ncbi:alpha-2-macroglobulin family protein [Olleya aquimaris]|uniref:TonB-dependent SusC/RagA subfamily outer membrane receptor n=1 Tax=Olleya aquimaris TaxID=639310 RepID=A0A327RE27_9FLAO|nr:MG2 domain-containing protein [Olleya aquimaris]RAJ14468.1 TonB-dependent SusC/RagA subfamily outer membrane receptor [Olleya aquimaris]
MKHLFTFLMIVLFATSYSQTNNYSKLWNNVETHEINGLPKSALEVVKTIEAKAVAENNNQQRIKVLLFKSKFALLLEEDAQLSIINDFKAEIAKSKAPTKNVLENMLATLYWQYFQQNRYKFYNRTKTEEKADTIDFRTWDLETLFAEIKFHFDNSLKNGLLLQQTSINQFDEIITKGRDSEVYRPTVFDFLSHNALAFYKTSENSITKPAYKFLIDNPEYLSASEAFSKINITSKDSTSLQLQALKVYQDLIQFHLKDKEPYALTEVNTERLDYVYYNATFENKEDIYLKALQAEAEKHSTHEVSGLYNFKIATLYNTQGQAYNKETNPEVRFKIKEALDLCKQVIADFPDSKGAGLCTALQSQILQPSLTITAEQFVTINTQSRFLIGYKNVEQLTFEAHKITRKQRDAFINIYKEDDKKAFIDKLNVEKSWTSSLKNENDYQHHTTEVLVPNLDNGLYLIVGQSTDLEDNFFATAITQVTNIAIVNFQDENQVFYQVINRNNGQPLPNAKVDIDYVYRNEIINTVATTTDSKGIISINKNKSYKRNNVALTIKTKSDVGYFGNYYISNYYRNRDDNDTNYRAFIFTDRSIYRPSQTVFFKAIALKNKNNKTEVIANKKVNVILYNTNGEKVSEQNLTTNNFGSVAGEFILPNNGLTGVFNIRISNNDLYGNTSISVEEYKRPKFETNFNPITETFKVNDSVTVKGEAISFAGSKITDAKVIYRVVRNVQYPVWYRWYRPSYFNVDPQEITHGETTTDAEGNYKVVFKAIPDETVDKSGLPIFSYQVTADVTDINGETRSTSTIVKVGYHALTATIGIKPVLDKTEKDHQITITTQNLNGQFVPAKGTLNIYKLQAPNTVLRQRPWAAPDYPGFTKNEFKSFFPHDAYTNEDNPENWEKGDLVLTTTFDTEQSKTIDLKNIKKWLSGAYIIELETTDKFGQDVKDKAKTMLFSDKDNTLADQQLFSITTDKSSYEVGDKVVLTLATAAKNLTVTVSVERDYQIEKNYVITLNENKKTISIPVEESDLGGFGIHYSLAAFNSYQGGSMTINVPYPKTDLDIETLTFRDKLQPGTDETWSFKIKGTKGEKIASEFLASMYDASLDQFKSHNWNYSNFTPRSYYASYRRGDGNSFGTTYFRVNRPYNYTSFNNLKSFDQFNWFGFTINNNSWAYRQYVNKLKVDRIRTAYDGSVKKGFVTGTVTDENGLPLPTGNVIVKGTSEGTSTDFDGNYLIKASAGDILQFSYVGYETLEKTVGADNIINIKLFPSDENLDEVVVVGYGTKKRSRRDSKSVVMDDLEMEAGFLQGNVAGVQVENDSKKVLIRGNASINELSNPLYVVDGVIVNDIKSINTDDILEMSVLKGDEATALYGVKGANGVVIITTKKGAKEDFSQVKARTNLQETAFFFPQLATDKNGNVSFNFTTPEALTRWNINLFAHDQQGNYAKSTMQTVTQKDLMVLPNVPRFLRQGDRIQISTKISNLSDKELSGTAVLQLFDALTGQSIDAELSNSANQQSFSATAKGNTQVTWTISIPDNVSAVQYKILAKSGEFSDGEQNALPVLTNRMLVTETLPMWIKSNETRTFTLDKLKTSSSSTLKHHKLTLEMTSNPAWYAVQALPYLMEYPYECNEQTFSRFYANSLASHIVNSNPRIKEVFNQWKNSDALLSNLEKNEELKSILIQETPWLRDAQSETEQKKRIALLFDLNKMTSELNRAKRKLKNNQMSDGGWSWFGNYRANRYITQHIITGFGHLKQLGVISDKDGDIMEMVEDALDYLDNEFEKEYNDLTKYTNDVDYTKDHLSYTQLHYLYMRSFFPEYKQSQKQQEIHKYYLSQIRNYWLQRPLYAKGMMTLIMSRNNDTTTAHAILKSLKENSITSDELGMYWKENTNSYYWYQASIETQALMIEAFAEVGKGFQSETKNLEDIDNLKIWLLKNKQTNRWKTTKATTEAVYALLLQGSDWLSVTDMVDVVLGDQKITPATLEDVKVEAGTGYYKTSWSGSDIKPEMANVTLTKKGEGIAWGALYWQYFEDLDKITAAETPLKLKKQLYLKTNTDTGEEISAITKDTKLKVGDLVRVRIELRSDRAMEFIHMKDMRAAGLEPVNVLSQYKYQDGLGYYEATKDASTNFFFDYLPKGIYVFEYDLRVNNAGNMSNGITTIQSMYAPEFSSHSEGVRITVE